MIQKPSGLLVHPSELAPDSETCMSLLRDQLGRPVYPVHRLDRGTSGALVFALSSEVASKLAAQIRDRAFRKKYLAVTRGYLEGTGNIDRPQRETPRHEYREARTSYRGLATRELPIPVRNYPASRFSLLEVETHTGRLHQIRKHLAALAHPIIGDTIYGDGPNNRLFREHLTSRRLLLHATHLGFRHPQTGADLEIVAPLPRDLSCVIERLGWTPCVPDARLLTPSHP